MLIFLALLKKAWTFQLKFWLSCFHIQLLVIQLKLLLSTKHFITFPGKINYLFGSSAILEDYTKMRNVYLATAMTFFFVSVMICLFICKTILKGKNCFWQRKCWWIGCTLRFSHFVSGIFCSCVWEINVWQICANIVLNYR